MDTLEDINEHVLGTYGLEGLEEAVLDALQGEFGDLSELEPDDLAPLDEFHIRGRASTVELAELVGDLSGLQVLDVGSGLGGTARYLASNYGAHVTGIDLTPAYVSLAQRLSEFVGLANEAKFQQAPALDIPSPDAEFDLVWMEHVQMNIPSKDRLAKELARVLRGGGKLAFHEIFSVAGAEPHFPVPWADAPFASALVPAEDFRGSLERAGLEAVEWQDVTQPSSQWANNILHRVEESGPPPIGLHLLMGESAPTKLGNVGKNLAEDRICVVQAVFQKS